MQKNNNSEGTFSDLRRLAEELLKAKGAQLQSFTGELGVLFHELQTHQIELELQNEELRQAQLDLIEMRDLYTELYDFAPNAYITISKKGLIKKSNLTFSKLLGIFREKLLNQPLSRYIDEKDQDIYYLHVRKVFEMQKKQFCELRLRTSENTPLWVRLDSLVVESTGGQSEQFRTIMSNITQGKIDEAALKRIQDELEIRIQERTSELKQRTVNMEESNIALKVLMEQRIADKKKLEKKILFNIRKLISPCLEKAQALASNTIQKTYLDILEKNINEITLPFAPQVSSVLSKLTPAEIQIANLIKQGKSNKEIAELLSLSQTTITTHRQRIRKKLGLTNKKLNLRSILDAK
jgi:PAS domain S-box-containing protein